MSGDINYLQWLNEEVRILVPVLWFLSGVIRGTPKIPSWFIPYLVILISIGFSWFLLDSPNVDRIIQGVIISAIVLTGNALAKRVIAPKIVNGNGGK